MNENPEKKELEERPWVKNFFTIKNIILALLAIITTISTFELERAKGRIESAQLALNQKTEEFNHLLKSREFESNLKIEMYKEAKVAIFEDSIKQAATLIIINEMLKDDSVFLWKLKSIISQVPLVKSSVVSQKKLRIFSELQNAISKDSFTVDIFYLEEIVGEALPRAQKVVNVLNKQFPKYKIRLRLLPASINSQADYRISANTLRCNKNEFEIANRIIEVIKNEKIFQLEQPRLQVIKNETPNYISLYIRNM